MDKNQFKQYRRMGIVEMRPYIPGEDLTNISVSKFDDPINDLGMIARDPEKHKDQWYVTRKDFELRHILINPPLEIKTDQVNEFQFQRYRRTGIAEMRQYIPGEDLTNISVSKFVDPQKDLGMIVRDPKNHKDQWYITRKHFEVYFEAV